MLRILGCNITKKIGIELVFQYPLEEVGPGMDPFDSHFPHGGFDADSSHQESFSFGNSRNAAASIEKPAGIEFVDSVPKSHLFL